MGKGRKGKEDRMSWDFIAENAEKMVSEAKKRYPGGCFVLAVKGEVLRVIEIDEFTPEDLRKIASELKGRYPDPENVELYINPPRPLLAHPWQSLAFREEEIVGKLDELNPPYIAFVLDGKKTRPLPWATPQGVLIRAITGTSSVHMLWGILLSIAAYTPAPPKRVELWALWPDPPRHVKIAEVGEETLSA